MKFINSQFTEEEGRIDWQDPSAQDSSATRFYIASRFL